MVAFGPVPDGPGSRLVYVDECENGSVFPNLAIDLEVNQVLVGAAPARLTALVGWYQLESWVARPQGDAQGALAWSDEGVYLAQCDKCFKILGDDLRI